MTTLSPPGELRAVAKLCQIKAPYEMQADTDFLTAMREICKWHIEHSQVYASLCKQQSFDPQIIKCIDDLKKIPYLPANFFKYHEALSISRNEVDVHLTSSGTTGQKSQMYFDRWSLGIAQQMVDRIFAHYGWDVGDQAANYLLYTYEQRSDAKLGTAFTDHYLCRYAKVNAVFTALRYRNEDKHEFDVFGSVAALQRFAAEGLPVRIFGFPAFFAATLQHMRANKLDKLKLHPQSLVFLGGGWKGQQERAISKAELYDQATEMLGIPNHRLRDGFGSVEHCIPYIECEYHEFHIPVWSRVIIRDPWTLEPLPPGEKGILQFISPYITSVPAHAVLMGDAASLHEGCPCGSEISYFRIHGRAGLSKNRSCAVAASELLKDKI